MRIALDLMALIARPTGVDRSLLGLVGALAAIDRQNQYFLFVNREDRSRFDALALPESFRVLPLSGRGRGERLFFQQVRLPAILAALRIDVLHSPTFVMPLWRGRRGHVLTVHDMSSFLLPDSHPRSRRGRLYELAVATSIRRAGRVCVPAASVKADLLRLLPDAQADRVEVIPNGIDEAFHPRPEMEIAAALARLAAPRPYILYVGTIDPRKNLNSLLEAYRRLVVAGRREHLVLAGQAGWSTAGLTERVAAAALQGRVHLLGYVPEAELPFLYSGASVFVYPSWLEGFGYPPLEAMATGVPVVASSSSALGDNLAGAAELVAPEDVQKLAEAIERLLTDEELRGKRIAAGRRRAAEFRWSLCAERMLQCYQAVSAEWES